LTPLKKIAVTGGLACGKTTVCRIFEDLGATVINSDEIVHRLLKPGTSLGKQVIETFGSQILDEKEINRNKLASLVFSDKQKLRALEQILHPAVIDEIKNTYERVAASGTAKLFVAEIPLLYETESHNFYNAVIAVVAEPMICKQRYISSGKEFDNRMAHQLPMSEKAARADYVIHNNGNLDDLRRQVAALFPILQSTP
jgi:dephospho-CoA kinase